MNVNYQKKTIFGKNYIISFAFGLLDAVIGYHILIYRIMRIFISYGHDKYIKFARQLAKAFNEYPNHVYEVWFDERCLRGGIRWEEYIENGLNWVAQDDNGRMILIMTPHSVRRPGGYCLNELYYALDIHLPVLPIMLVWTTPPLSIYQYQWLDLTHSQKTSNNTFESDFCKIIEALENENYYEDGNSRLLAQLLEPLDYSVDINYYLPSFVGRKWFFDEFEQWINNKDSSRIFLLSGLPGIGKTSIAVKIIETYPNVAAYHLIRKGDSEKTSLKRAICTIAYQLSKQLPDYYEQLIRVDISTELSRCNDVALFNILIATPLFSCAERTEPILIVIDALDESISGNISTFARFVINIMDKLPKWVRFVLTSRPEDAVLLPLQAYKPHVLDSQNNNNTKDILSYIIKKVRENYGNISIINCKKIANKSEGIFLYAKYVCDDLLHNNDNGIDARNLPSGIGAIYFEFFSQNYPDIISYRKKIRPILELIAAQVEPFSIEMLADCLNVDTDDIEDFLSDFHVLFTLDSKRRIYPFHSSIIDWLINKDYSGHYAVKHENGTKAIAEWLYKNFLASGCNFFNDNSMGRMLETWFPEILEKTNHLHFDTRNVISNYIKQIKGRKILQDLVSNHKRFHFIKSILKYIFKQPNFEVEILEEEVNRNKEIGKHGIGLRYLYEYAQKGKVDVPRKELSRSEYYYFVNVQIPMFYVQSSYDADYIFKSLVQGLICAFREEGHGPNMNDIFDEIRKLAIDSFTESGHLAVKYLKEVAPSLKTDFEDIWANRAEQNAVSISQKLEEKGYNYNNN